MRGTVPCCIWHRIDPRSGPRSSAQLAGRPWTRCDASGTSCNVYTANLHPSRMSGLLEELAALWSRLQVELSAFAGLLAQMADPDR